MAALALPAAKLMPFDATPDKGLWAVVFVLGVLFALLIGSVILRMACYMCGVREPSLGAAMGMVLLVAVLSVVVQFGAGLLLAMYLGPPNPQPGVGFLIPNPQMRPGQVHLLFHAVGFLINMLVAAGTYSTFMPEIGFARGVMIYFTQILLMVVLAVLIVALLVLFGVVRVDLQQQF
jgi:hypothetical protein